MTEPSVTVLMATYNGMPYLPAQVDSILNQVGVSVELVVSDDQSEDGSWKWLVDRAATDDRITLLPRIERSGGFGANFYRLVCDAGVGELVAFSDQDDVWRPEKLAHQANALHEAECDGISSNVTAVTADGARTLIRKSHPQRRLDYLCEAPGPGSTFLLTHRLAALIRTRLTDSDGSARAVLSHDWLCYAICRAHGWRWLIEATPWVDYRQHESNALGANWGLGPARERLQRVRSGWYRTEVEKVVDAVVPVADDTRRAELENVRDLLVHKGFRSTRRLAALAPQLRRRPRDRWLLGAIIAADLW